MSGPFVTSADIKAALAGKANQPLNTPSQGQVLTVDTSSTAGVSWVTPAAGSGGTTSDATATSKGVVQLAGDLAGTAAAPTLRQINGGGISAGDSDSIPHVVIDGAGRVIGLTQVDVAIQPSNIPSLVEFIQDTVAQTLQPGSNVTISYSDDAGTITVSAAGGSGSGGTSTPSESYVVSMRRQNADGSYPNVAPTQPDSVPWFVGTAVPDSSNLAVRDGALYSAIDTSS